MDFRKILIAVDASENALRAVEYTGEMVGRMAGNGPQDGFRVTLLYVERLPDRDLYPDDATWKAKCVEHRDTVRRYMELAEAALVERGVPAGWINSQYLSSCRSPLRTGDQQCSLGTSIAQEIINVIGRGGYGTAVVGRRGVSKAEEFLFGSVSNKIIHTAKDCTIWVVA
jgi:nucleotide-binding universal stress UspA family protein